MAAVTATRLMQFVISSFNFQPANLLSHVHMWTDSQIVLHWIYKQHHLMPFIAHRVTEIITAFPATIWSFTPSADNPADLLTRGISSEQLLTSQLWMHGPQWLQFRQNWPQWTPTNALLQLSTDEDNDDNEATLSPTVPLTVKMYQVS